MAGVDRPAGALVYLLGVVVPLIPLLLRSWGITRLPPATPAELVVEDEDIKFMKLMMAVDLRFSLSKKMVPGGY